MDSYNNMYFVTFFDADFFCLTWLLAIVTLFLFLIYPIIPKGFLLKSFLNYTKDFSAQNNTFTYLITFELRFVCMLDWQTWFDGANHRNVFLFQLLCRDFFVCVALNSI